MRIVFLTCILNLSMLHSEVCIAQFQSKNQSIMKVAIWDTYVTKKDGTIMHFDIIAPEAIRDTSIIYRYGREYIKEKGQGGQALTSRECRFCHIRAVHPQWEYAIRKKGYHIIEMENCN
jgi:hypothetical protein